VRRDSLLRFRPFTVDSQRHVLMREGDDVALSPHLVDILTFLAQRAGQIVSKDALLEAFWPDVHVTENTLTRAIADIRKALGDDPSEPRYIQTVARRGYRFVATVESRESTPDSSLNGTTRGEQEVASLDVDDPFREWVRGRLSLETLDATKLPAAVAAFEHAVAATPEYAPAHAGLANAFLLTYETTRAQNAPNREPLTLAVRSARRACELDPALGEAWATLGFVLTAAGQGEEARAAARRAAALEPTSWRHHFRLGVASWGEERLRAVDRTLSLLPNFAPGRFLAAMVFIARQAFGPAMVAAAQGSAAQARELDSDGVPFPSVGLHWLHGLLLLRLRQVGPAITEFGREMDASRRGRIYADEFRVNAQVAAGFAHLSVDDATGATEAFRSALETLPRNGRALIGLYQALTKTSLAPEARVLLPRIDEVIAELGGGGRLGEAALISAASLAARGDLEAGCAVLHRLLDTAPPGQAGWLISVDPALTSLRTAASFDDLIAKLAARAA
jgi:DNA-binding winged helix-turn-helix (wHTH) protein